MTASRNRVFLVWVILPMMFAEAKTVALWPLDTDNLRCVVNPSNDFGHTSYWSESDTGAQWELPPNPDSDRHAFEPLNGSAVRETLSGNSGDKGFLFNRYSGRHLRRDKAFTVEGWIKVLQLPASNNWACILCAYDTKAASDSSDKNRWLLSLRRRPNESYACSWILWCNSGNGDIVLHRYADEESSYAMTNTWMHIALVHTPLVNGIDHWAFYLNGVKAGETDDRGGVSDSYEHDDFDLGARRSMGNQINAVFDYWRISDKVLAPSEFLCAGDSGGTPVLAASHTIAYWPLGVTEAGGIDCRDAVGTSPLTGGFGSSFSQNRMTPVEDCAFIGNPPNPTVTLPGGNAGSVLGCATAACLQRSDVGAFLNVTSNFTVEGWFCPRICERPSKSASQETVAYLFGTRPDYDKGWALQYRAKGVDKVQFDIYCVDGTKTLRDNAVLSGEYDMASWYDKWRHVALVYDAAGGSGYGLWTLYIDGEVVGSTANAREPVPITSSRMFFVGGRAEVADQSFQGKVDCVRVCAAALSPLQFLNASDGVSATDVVALWPLNVKNGAFPDLHDVSGNGRHFSDWSGTQYEINYAKILATADADAAPVISNPDKTPAFRGDPSAVNGSVRFRNPDAATDNHFATLMTGSKTVMSSLARGSDFTFECYWLHRSRTASASGYQETFFCPSDSTTAKIRFFRKTDGFYIWENLNATISDTKISGTSDSDLEYDRWYHVALVHSIETVDGVRSSVWRVYLDGLQKGMVSETYNGSTSVLNMLYVGGRYWSANNSVIGNLSSVRLSDCALDPSDFLCATPAPVAKPEPTVAYWPIDSVQPGLANLVDEEYPLEAYGTAAGSVDKARGSIPNNAALTNVVAGTARRNHGSYALGAGGVLAAASIGFEMAGPKPFTIEGWIKWTPSAGTDEEDLVSVGDASSANGGLRIYFDKTGSSPKLRVFARGAWPCTPYVDGSFDADLTSLAGKWTHLAIAYDSNDGDGAWTLYVEGKHVGSKVKNFYRPTSIDYSRGGDFRIGSTASPLSAAVDMWRVGTVAFGPNDLLYAPPMGMYLWFR